MESNYENSDPNSRGGQSSVPLCHPWPIPCAAELHRTSPLVVWLGCLHVQLLLSERTKAKCTRGRSHGRLGNPRGLTSSIGLQCPVSSSTRPPRRRLNLFLVQIRPFHLPASHRERIGSLRHSAGSFARGCGTRSSSLRETRAVPLGAHLFACRSPVCFHDAP